MRLPFGISPSPPTPRLQLASYKIQNAIDLQKAKEDLLLEAKEIKSPRERKRVIENINAAVDDIEYFNEQ